MTEHDASALAAALSRVELRELALLSWGIVDGSLTADELRETLAEGNPATTDLLEQLIEQRLVVETPSGGYRSRMAETLRLLSTLQQTFPQQEWWQGTPLVLDYRVLHRPRRRPMRDRPRREVVDELAGLLGGVGRSVIDRLAPERLSGFQERSITAVLQAIAVGRDAGVMVAAGTGGGKTLGFYLPLLGWLSEVGGSDSPGTTALALYPRGELLKDQLRSVLMLTRELGSSSIVRPIRVATWFGPTPRAPRWLSEGWADTWSRTRVEAGAGWVCPYLTCLTCSSDLVWLERDVEQGVERLTCSDRRCGDTIDDRYLSLTRQSAVRRPADVMFTTTESLNRQLAAPDQHRAFGLRPRTLRFVLLDEVHTYEGVSGAQNALLARRLRHAAGRPLVWVGLSATLRNAESFFAEFTGLYGDRVAVSSVQEDELEEAGAEYLVALRHDPSSGTGPLSTTIQASMLLARCLDAPGTPYEPAPSSEGLFGRRVFVFTDKLDVTNRLYWDLLDAEGWWQPRRPKSRPVLTLAHLRAEEQLRRPPGLREEAADRDSDGQWWWLAEALGRDLGGDEQLEVGRTSSQDVGVDRGADVVVATAALEVGYDDATVGAIIQHKAPHDAARFLQRKGRAGRDPRMRPWTTVVLSDHGRDRMAWETYDDLFDPELEPRHLPLSNRYVLRMQAVYSTLDWLGGRLASVGRDASAWADLAAPADVLESSAERVTARAERQAAEVVLLKEVLDGGPARDQLRSHLRRSLGFTDDDEGWRQVDALLWTPPRALMLTVIPTIRRRLSTGWAGERPTREAHAVRTRTPLLEFVAGNLFDDLLTPEVEVLVPTGSSADDFASEVLPAVRTLRELMPGNVTRHFGVSSFSRRHWVNPAQSEVNVVDAYGASAIGVIESPTLPVGGVELFRPLSVRLAVPPEPVRDASSVQPEWEVHCESLGTGQEIDLGRGRWEGVILSARAHMHTTGGGARVRRFARRASGTIWSGGTAQPYEVAFVSNSPQPAALGIEVDVDALSLGVAAARVGDPTRLERTDYLAHLIDNDLVLRRELSWYQRSALCSALLVVLCEFDDPRAQVVRSLPVADLGPMVADALARLGLARVTDPDAADAHGYAVDDSRDRQQTDADWWTSHSVLSAGQAALARASGDVDDEWAGWRNRRFAATVGQVLLEAAGWAIPSLDTSELVLDIDPRGVAGSAGVEVWLTEASPGGNGQIEEIFAFMRSQPKQFTRTLDRLTEKSELGRLDEQIHQFLEFVDSDDELATATRAMRAAWPGGHNEVARTFGVLRQAAIDSGLEQGRLAWSVIVNRMLGPGSSDTLLPTARALLGLWERSEAKAGFEISARVLGALAAAPSVAIELEDAFRLPASPSPERRARAVSSFFWPRGGSATRAQFDSGNPFGLLPAVDPSTVLLALGPSITKIELGSWSDADSARVADVLSSEGRAVLVFDSAARDLARSVLLALQETPIDAGALLLCPRVVAVYSVQPLRIEVELEGAAG